MPFKPLLYVSTVHADVSASCCPGGFREHGGKRGTIDDAQSDAVTFKHVFCSRVKILSLAIKPRRVAELNEIRELLCVKRPKEYVEFFKVARPIASFNPLDI